MADAPGTAFQRQKGFDLLVIGGGIAGLTAAWHGARLGVTTALLEASAMFGGQVATLGEVDDYPLTAHASGTDLASTLAEAARRAGASFSEAEAIGLEPGGRLATVRTAKGDLRARNVVIASGARLRMLDAPGAAELVGRGVSQCATCDGPFYRNKDVAVVGGGDGALQEALELAKVCRQVNVIVRGRLSARQAYIDAASKCANLVFVWDSVVEAVIGEAGVDGVRLRNLKTGAESELACFGLFPFVGTEPNSEFAGAAVKRTASGHIKADKDFKTSAPGVYAIGAVREGFSGTLASAAGEGASVAAAVAARCRK